MVIRITKFIDRRSAISRIREVAFLISNREFRKLEDITHERASDIRNIVEEGVNFNIDELEKWTDNMLGDQMDEPLYRYSMFDNYLVSED